jgi:CHAD domain-containing protein
MAYRIKAKEPVQQSVRRVACEQVDQALAEIEDERLDRHEVVHQLRKRCKKVRGLIRLVRPQFEKTYQQQNAWFRDLARRFSFVRDAQSMIETFDTLVEHFREQLAEDQLGAVRQQLEKRRVRLLMGEFSLNQELQRAADELRAQRRLIQKWRLRSGGYSAIGSGLKQIYARGADAMARAQAHPSLENYHQWRKRAKYHWYHLRLLKPIWTEPLKAWSIEAKALSDFLGDDRDLSLLRQAASAEPEQFGRDTTVQTLVGLIDRRQAELRHIAQLLGRRIYAEAPKRFAKRFQTYWSAWRSEQRRSRPKLARKSEP